MSATDKIKLAKKASSSLAIASTVQKDTALEAIAKLLVASVPEIVAANKNDLEKAKTDGLSEGLQDRLMLNADRIGALASSMR